MQFCCGTSGQNWWQEKLKAEEEKKRAEAEAKKTAGGFTPAAARGSRGGPARGAPAVAKPRGGMSFN